MAKKPRIKKAKLKTKKGLAENLFKRTRSKMKKNKTLKRQKAKKARDIQRKKAGKAAHKANPLKTAKKARKGNTKSEGKSRAERKAAKTEMDNDIEKKKSRKEEKALKKSEAQSTMQAEKVANTTATKEKKNTDKTESKETSWWEDVKQMLKEGTEIVTTAALEASAEWHKGQSDYEEQVDLDPREHVNQRNEILDTKEHPLTNAVMAYELALLMGDEKGQEQAKVTLMASIEECRKSGQTDAQIYQHIAKIHQACTMTFGITQKTNPQTYQQTVGAQKENTPISNALYSFNLALLQGDKTSLKEAKKALTNCVSDLRSNGQSNTQIYQRLFTAGDRLNPALIQQQAMKQTIDHFKESRGTKKSGQNLMDSPSPKKP